MRYSLLYRMDIIVLLRSYISTSPDADGSTSIATVDINRSSGYQCEVVRRVLRASMKSQNQQDSSPRMEYYILSCLFQVGSECDIHEVVR